MFLLALHVTPAAADEVRGNPRVLSGDTLRFGKATVRLIGIDAPELDQFCENEYGKPYECGYQALDALKAMIGRISVVCVGTAKDAEGALLAVCHAGDANLNSRMVRSGWAVARPQVMPEFGPIESLAKSEKAGIWKYKFTDPEEYRKKNP